MPIVVGREAGVVRPFMLEASMKYPSPTLVILSVGISVRSIAGLKLYGPKEARQGNYGSGRAHSLPELDLTTGRG